MMPSQQKKITPSRFSAKISESEIQRQLIKRYEKDGFYVIKIIKANKAGIPDLLIIKDGVAQFVEAKSATGIVSDLQRLRAKELRQFGCVVRFVTQGNVDIPEGEIKKKTEFGF